MGDVFWRTSQHNACFLRAQRRMSAAHWVTARGVCTLQLFFSEQVSDNVEWSEASVAVKSLRVLRLIRLLRVFKLQAMVGVIITKLSVLLGTVARLLQVVFWMTVRLICPPPPGPGCSSGASVSSCIRAASDTVVLACRVTQLVAHLMGCMWYFIAQDAGLGSGTWADSYHMVTRPIVSRYIISVYWAFVTVSAVWTGSA